MVYDVLVMGAGMAGLAAARVCAEKGLRVLVLEASERVGGRILTQRTATGAVVELGAEFVHGDPPELLGLIAEAGLSVYERTGDFFRLEGSRYVQEDDGDDDVLEALKSYTGDDRPFAEYARALGLPDEELEAELGYVEGFNAADAREASIIALGRQQAAEDAIGGSRVWRVREGYDRVPEFLAKRVRAAGGEIVFGARVDELAWGEWGVEAGTRDGRRFKAQRAVVALPLGLFQSQWPGLGAPRFRPEPSAIFAAMQQMRMGDAVRVTMVFKRRLWPEGMSFLLTPGAEPRVWWTNHPADDQTLTGWIGGPRATPLTNHAAAEVEHRFFNAAAAALQVSRAELDRQLLSAHWHDWGGDPNTLGAYSWVATGGADASARMAEPVDNCLFFAGEHTDITGHWGTVHGALRSGLRAGAQVLVAAGR